MATKISSREIILSKNIWLGRHDAPVSLVEYGDYQSAGCALAHQVVKQLMVEFDGKVKFNFRHFPLSQVNQYAMKAAEAAVAAAQEGKFWEMHDTLFAHRSQLGTISLKNYAREIGIRDKRFLDSLVNSIFSWQVRDDLLQGLQKGVRDVPSFFINGELLTAEPTFENLTLSVQRLIKKQPD